MSVPSRCGPIQPRNQMLQARNEANRCRAPRRALSRLLCLVRREKAEPAVSHSWRGPFLSAPHRHKRVPVLEECVANAHPQTGAVIGLIDHSAIRAGMSRYGALMPFLHPIPALTANFVLCAAWPLFSITLPGVADSLGKLMHYRTLYRLC